MTRVLGRLLRGIAAVAVLLGAGAAWLLYAPQPASPVLAAEHVSAELDGRMRHYTVVAPPSLAPGAGVVLVFHPSQSSGTAIRRIVGGPLERMAGRGNFVVVYPDGYEGHFNDCRRVASYSARTLNVDDVGFARHIVERLAATRAIDAGRVYAVGHSNGGHMALRMALEAPELVAGIASIAASMPVPDNLDCAVAAALTRRVVLVAGTEDPINPYQGGAVTLFGFGNRGDVLSAQASARWFAARLGLTEAPETATVEVAGLVARSRDWAGPDARVRLVTIEGGGHTIPQAAYRFPRLFGATFRSHAVLESIWRLFEEED